jgi:pimeloyl-ACP methyl ester carboxylesterase
MNSHVVTSDGIAIAYDRMGEGPPVVLVHGFGASRAITWGNTSWYQALRKAGRMVIALDCRGHGESGKPHVPEAYDEGRLALDVVAVLDGLGLPQTDIIGYSMGAQIAIRLMQEAGARLRRAVLAGVGETYFRRSAEQTEAIAQGLLAADMAEISDPLAREFRLFCERAGGDLTALAACMRRPRRAFAIPELKALPHKVLVVCGESDAMTGSPEPLAAAFSDGRSLIVPRRNHHSTVGDNIFKDAALSFLNQARTDNG